MLIKKILCGIILALAGVNLLYAQQQVPDTLTIQGRLSVPGVFSGVKADILRDGTTVQELTIDLIPDDDGVFTTVLSDIDKGIFSSGSDFFITFSSSITGELLGSVSLNSVPFGFRAQSSVSADSAQTLTGNIFTSTAAFTAQNALLPGVTISSGLIISDGNVGIGTTSPPYKLVVSTGAGEAGTLLAVSTGASDVFRVTGGGGVYANKFYGDGSALAGVITSTATGNYSLNAANITGNLAASQVAAGALNSVTSFTASSATIIGNAFSVGGSTLVVNGGNVGIGTTGPGEKLGIAGNITLQNGGAYKIGSVTASDNVVGFGHINGVGVYIGVYKANGGGTLGTHSMDAITILQTSGNVGIGTTSPQASLVVSNGGAAGLELFTHNSSGGTGTYLQSYNRAGSAFTSMEYYASSHALMGGNVGIGTTNPLEQLYVYEAGTGAEWRGRGAFAGGTNAAIIGEYNGKAVVGAHNAALNAWADLYVNTVDGTTGMVVKTSGNVGIGTTGPGYKLDVGGEIRATGAIRTNTGTTVYQGNKGCANGGGFTTAATCATLQCGSDMGGPYYYKCDGSCGTTTRSPITCNNTFIGRLLSSY